MIWTGPLIQKIFNLFIIFVFDLTTTPYEWSRLRLIRRLEKRRGQKIQDFPLISIILPTYNRLELLSQRALPSVFAQTYPHFELLVVSHGCGDGTDEYVADLAQIDRRVRLIKVPRRRLGYPRTAENHWLAGPVNPIRTGLFEANGSWIARIDDDDVWTPTHLEQSITNLRKSDAEFISSSHLIIDSNGSRTLMPQGSPPVGGVATWLYKSSLRFFKPNIHCWRRTWNRVNDTELIYRMIRAGVRISHFCDVGAILRPRPGEEHIGSKAYFSHPQKYETFYNTKDLK